MKTLKISHEQGEQGSSQMQVNLGYIPGESLPGQRHEGHLSQHGVPENLSSPCLPNVLWNAAGPWRLSTSQEWGARKGRWLPPSELKLCCPLGR